MTENENPVVFEHEVYIQILIKPDVSTSTSLFL